MRTSAVKEKHWSHAPSSDDMIYVYVMECAGFYKVGITGNLSKRLRSVQMANPLPVDIVMYRTTHGLDIREVENRIHTRLASFKMHGEWFNAPFAQIELAVRRSVAKSMGMSWEERRARTEERSFLRGLA